MTFKELLNRGTSLLKQAGIENAGFDARQLMESWSQKSSVELLSCYNEQVNHDKQFLELIHRRINHEPLQYIIGEWEFYSLPFKVGKGVLIPRPETELIPEFVIDKVGSKTRRVIDLCAGTGAIGISISHFCPNALVTAVEFYDKALEYLKKNKELNKADNVNVVKADALTFKPQDIGWDIVDVICCNPPYVKAEDMDGLQEEVKMEPKTALTPGEDDLLFYKNVLDNCSPYLSDTGFIAFEVGVGQAEDVRQLVRKHGLVSTTLLDMNGIHRVVIGAKDKNFM